MRKVMLLTMVLALAVANVCMSKDKKVKLANLPATVQQFIKKNFPKARIKKIAQESDDLDYNVTFDNGAKLEFGKDNQWSEIYCKKTPFPVHLIPQQIVAYVQRQYPRTSIQRVERCSQGYDIDLNNNKHFQLSRDFKPTYFKETD
jgi:hypothetical protein